jgi:hypothetical protein
MAKTRETSHLRVRIDPIRLAKLEKAAEKNGLTLTGEIVRRLDESFERDKLSVTLDGLPDRIAAKVAAMFNKGSGES